MEELYRKARALFAHVGVSGPKSVLIVVATAIFTTAFGFAVVVWLPADHFLPRPAPDSWWRRHWLVRSTLLVLKNVLGVAVLLVGIIMLVAPGPGLVFSLLGVSLLDFPGKRGLQRRLVRRPKVMGVLNDLRARFHRPPFVTEAEPE